MNLARLFLAATLGSIPILAAAQDAPLIDFNHALDHARTTGRMVEHAQRRQRGVPAVKRATPRQAAACAQKQAFRRQYGASNPKVVQLYRLCRGVGR